MSQPFDTTSIVDKIVATATPLEAFMLLVIIGLAWFAWSMISRQAEMQKAAIDALVNNTTVMSEIKEMVRNVLYTKN